MEWSDRDAENLLCQLLDIGEAMLADGAEVKRVEDTLIRMGRASGAVRMSVFVITSSMVVTMGLADAMRTAYRDGNLSMCPLNSRPSGG